MYNLSGRTHLMCICLGRYRTIGLGLFHVVLVLIPVEIVSSFQK